MRRPGLIVTRKQRPLTPEERLRATSRARICVRCRRDDDEDLGPFTVAEPIRCERDGEEIVHGLVVMVATTTVVRRRRDTKMVERSAEELQ